MHIVFGVTWHIEVKDVGHGRNVQTARGHIRGHKNAQIIVAEPVKGLGPVALIQIAVDRGRLIAVFIERFGNDIHVRLAVAKDDRVRTGFAFGVNQLAQQFTLFRRFLGLRGPFEHHDALLDVDVRRCRASHFDLGRIGQERVCNTLDLGGHRGAEKQRLTRKWRAFEDFLDVGDKAHVEHPVRFVDDHDLHICQNQFATLKVVQQTTRCCDQNIDAFVDQLVLILEAGATNQQRFGQLRIFCIGVEVFGNLCCQLAGWRKDQRARHPRAGTPTAEQRDHRQGEGGSFACTCLGNAQHIAAFKGGGDCTGLNRGRGVVACFGDGL